MSVSLETELSLMSELATAGYYIGIRIREAKADIVYNTYPEEWRQRYLAMSYRLRDPSIAWAYCNDGATCWSDLAALDTAGVFADAARHGLAHGMVVATGDIRLRTIAGFARPDRPFTRDEALCLQATVRRLHKHAQPQSVTVRQLQALRLIARGHPYSIAAHALQISESALKARIALARRSLGARTVPEAVQIAQEKGII